MNMIKICVYEILKYFIKIYLSYKVNQDGESIKSVLWHIEFAVPTRHLRRDVQQNEAQRGQAWTLEG